MRAGRGDTIAVARVYRESIDETEDDGAVSPLRRIGSIDIDSGATGDGSGDAATTTVVIATSATLPPASSTSSSMGSAVHAGELAASPADTVDANDDDGSGERPPAPCRVNVVDSSAIPGAL